MLTAVVILVRTLGLICCGHRAVALENLALRQQLAALKRSAGRPQLRTRDRVFGSFSPRLGGTGARPCSSFSPTPSSAGIASGCAGGGQRARARRAEDVRRHMRTCGRSSRRWPRRIRSGERLGFTANCRSWVWRSPSARSHGSYAGLDGRLKRNSSLFPTALGSPTGLPRELKVIATE